ncbi:hypothetical protein [Proteiniclasticum sp. QWL-01]|uniref:hypothetical protein n=1 Tax=Proteiniclasticum sp. QWL-01 TaxID=3036945 RepID=UPI00240F0CB4|nr:hypothetical protein [Proteiniclasticum sp. QWL-01]WFF71672.1 hypothetical protein P6M73_10150 [Proteiniclasticum sp. QWL-01]
MEVLLIPIEVVATFSRDGRITPLRFRVILSDAGYETIMVDQISRRRRERSGNSFIDIYTCSGPVQEQIRMFELKYEISTGEWFLYRM